MCSTASKKTNTHIHQTPLLLLLLLLLIACLILIYNCTPAFNGDNYFIGLFLGGFSGHGFLLPCAHPTIHPYTHTHTHKQINKSSFKYYIYLYIYIIIILFHFHIKHLFVLRALNVLPYKYINLSYWTSWAGDDWWKVMENDLFLCPPWVCVYVCVFAKSLCICPGLSVSGVTLSVCGRYLSLFLCLSPEAVRVCGCVVCLLFCICVYVHAMQDHRTS